MQWRVQALDAGTCLARAEVPPTLEARGPCTLPPNGPVAFRGQPLAWFEKRNKQNTPPMFFFEGKASGLQLPLSGLVTSNRAPGHRRRVGALLLAPLLLLGFRPARDPVGPCGVGALFGKRAKGAPKPSWGGGTYPYYDAKVVQFPTKLPY